MNGDSLPALLRAVAAADPDRIAVRVDGGDGLTFGRWDARSDALARGLHDRGAGRGARVALVFEPRHWCDYAVAYLAVHKAGATAVAVAACAGQADLTRALRAARADAVLAGDRLGPAAHDVPVHDPRALESEGAGGGAPPGRFDAAGEILVEPRPLGPAHATERTREEVLAPCPWLHDVERAPRWVAHAFAPGTLAGQDGLRAALGAVPVPCVVLPAFTPDRFSDLVTTGGAGALHPATAQMLLERVRTTGRDLSAITRLALVGGRPSPRLLAGLRALLPPATLWSADAAAPGIGAPTATGTTRVGPAASTAGLTAAVRAGSPPPADATPVAFSQEGMLWHEHFAPGCQNLPGLARRYRGPLDVAALERALDEIVRRHAPLRTTFRVQDGRLCQDVRPPGRCGLAVRDLRSLPERQRVTEVDRQVTEAGQRPFDLVTDALFAPTLLRVADDEHVLVIRTHHSAFDDWSVGVFRRELAALYTAFSEGRPSPLEDLPVAFTDAAREQRRRLAGPAGAREARFWRGELDGAPLTTQLPVDDPDRPEGSLQAAGRPVRMVLPRSLHERLRELARAERTTVFMVLLAAYGALVQRYTGNDDLLLATVVANRNRTELEPLIGCFTKKVPLRLRLDGDLSFTDLVGRTRTALLGALAHQDLPFEAVVQDMLAAPAAAHGLVPHVALMFQGETPRQHVSLPGLDTAGFETATTTRRAHFMAGEEGEPADRTPPWGAGLYGGTFLILSVAESAEELVCVARGAFHAQAVRALLDTYVTLLTDAVADPGRPLSGLQLLDAPGEAAVRARGRGPAGPAHAPTAAAAFAAHVRRRPDAVALRRGTATMTFAELDGRAGRLAERLRALGAGPGATVGVGLDCSTDAVVAVLGAWKAGAAWVGVNPDDDPERVTGILADASARVVVGRDPRGVIARTCPVITTTPADEVPGEAGTARARSAPGHSAQDPDAVAAVITAVGPSATARPVELSHADLLRLAGLLRHVAGAPTERSVWLSTAPTEHGFVRQLAPLLDGATLCLGQGVAAPATGLALLAAGDVDVVDGTPAAIAALLDAGLAEAVRRRPRTAVRPIVIVGTRHRPDPDLWARLRALADAHAAMVYAAPQAAFAATAAPVADSARPTVGVPLPGVEAHVLDPGGGPVPDRVRGVLHVGRAGSRLRPTDQRARRLPDGRVELCGPVDADTDLRGFPVDPPRIAAALADCPGVRSVTVHVDRSEGTARLVAQIAPDGPAPTPADLRAHLWQRLPGYACPSVVLLPRGTDGPAAPEDPLPASAGRSWRARMLGMLWADALGIDTVGPDANYWQDFTFLGVLARARTAGLALRGEQVTRNRTVDALAADLDTDTASRATGGGTDATASGSEG